MEPDTDLAAEIDPALQAAVDEAMRKVEAAAADPEVVYGDAVEAVALDCPVDVAVALCEQTIDFLPDTVRMRLFESEHAETISLAAEANAVRVAAEQKAQQRTARAATTRAATLAAEAALESAAIKSSTCPSCFTVRAASGVCACE
ncbi:MAG TPA: hypothetical protein VNA30_06945 [Mycobacteriales bacterium]|nr:hypothetical protein [Mycobacteriales bacterium]